MSDRDPDFHLAFDFGRQLRNKNFRAWLAKAGYISGMTITVVSEKTVIDQEVLRRTGQQVVQEAPGTEFGWRFLPE